MSSAAQSSGGQFVVATPFRTVCDDNARALERIGQLRFLALGTRRGSAGVAPERTRLNPLIGLASYAAARVLPSFSAESFRYRLNPWFDRWVRRRITPGDHIISSYGYANACFRWVRQHGGRTFLDGGNSHPENFWTLLEDEHRRWDCPLPPVARHHYERACAMIPDVDFVLSPSAFVSDSFRARGFQPAQILRNIYPLDLSCFTPAAGPRPSGRPLTVISTGSLSLRKGTPYLLAAFRLVLAREPGARLLLTEVVADSVKPVLARYADLPVDWAPALPHAALARRLREADIFVLPSIEDGFARTVAEALACGLPVITTPNTGASDLICPGENGEIVPIRDPQAIADAILKWWERRRIPAARPIAFDPAPLTVAHFETEFLTQLRALALIP